MEPNTKTQKNKAISLIIKIIKNIVLFIAVLVFSYWIIDTISPNSYDSTANEIPALALAVLVVFVWKKIENKCFKTSFSPSSQSTDNFESIFEDDVYDELYEEAKKLVFESGKTNVSYLQEKLRIGYARAFSLIDRMGKEGIIGPANGSAPRKILKTN